MNDKENSNKISQSKMKLFLIKLILASIAFAIVVNLLFNLIFAERLEKIDKILLLNRSDVRQNMKNKIRNELNDALKKDNLIYEEDKILLYKLFQKIKKEFQDIDKSKL